MMNTGAQYGFFEPDENTKKLSRFSEREIRKFICRTPPNHYPVSFYKFRQISEEKLKPFLINNAFYLSSRKQFNDPFDATVFPILAADGRQRTAWAKRVAKDNGASFKQRKAVLQSAQDPIIAEARLKWAIEANLDDIGIFSFAGNPRDILMWSHYGASHQGVCLRFELAKDVETFSHALPVKYSSEYPIINPICSSDSRELMDVLLRKAPHWSYEKESRFVEPSIVGKLIPYSPEALTHVIYGCNVTTADIEQVRSMIRAREKAGHPAPKELFAVKSRKRFSLGLFSQPVAPFGWDGRA